MQNHTDATSIGIDRRSFLTAGVTATAATAGCLQRARSIAARRGADTVSVTIKTTPADDDRYAIRIAQRLATHLTSVGIDVDVIPMRDDQLLRDILIDREYDLYVAAHGGGMDPDFLYPLLHSNYATDPGWQNPWAYSDIETDDLLEAQRRQTGPTRRESAWELQRVVARNHPFSVIALVDSIRAVRRRGITGWRPAIDQSPARYLALRPPTGARSAVDPDRESGARTGLHAGLTDGRATRNLNPIAVAFRNRGSVTDLLYEPLLARYRGGLVPWLASSLEWSDGDPPSVRIRLRDGLTWHDGRPLTAADAVFTYRFLADTSLGRMERDVPAPRFRGPASLVDRTRAVDDRSLRVEFTGGARDVAERALTVPILPAHEWKPRSAPADLAGVSLVEGTPEALVWPNMDPIGSGPFAFRRAVKDEVIILDRNTDHFAWDEPPDLPDRLVGEPAFDRLVFRVVPSGDAAVELLAAGEIDATGPRLPAGAVPTAARLDDVRVTVAPSRSFYHLGFNTQRDHLSNPNVRRGIARLLDRRRVVEDVFGGYATPAASPLDGTPWLAPGLEWRDRDPVVPFIGDAGRLDAQRAREVFRRAGYGYDADRGLLDG